jgi:GNAT superfamily N-acetyltransferase
VIRIEKVSVESIPVIQSLAEVTWAEAYREILSAPQLQYMLQLIYSTTSLEEQILKKKDQFIMAVENNAAIGFASYSPLDENDKSIFRLHKIYVDPRQQGKGTGKLLIDFIINDIKPAGANQLELNVNRENGAVHFYQKHGFHITREEDIDIGSGYFMNDYVMLKNL